MPTPEWIAKGRPAYQLYSNAAALCTIERLTPTQVIVITKGGREIRYRLKDLREVGVDFYKSTKLTAPDDPQVLALQTRERVDRAMSEVREVIQNLALGARLCAVEGPAEAMTIATSIRDAAQHAIDALALELKD